MSGMRIINADALTVVTERIFCDVCNSYKGEKCSGCNIRVMLDTINRAETLTGYVDGAEVVKTLQGFCLSDGCQPDLDCSDCSIGKLCKELKAKWVE